ncbi:hypothetical protein [Dietzia sp. ANT_WB102]|uniref:hypothetical protein n=1 Tax=Dietzia sp. ANT_WB102 TaxID=2597345 RepID=UPI0011EFDC72|nr:hypothetical protein [Dietzia sp. ANT_WB102]KAA0916449.1 hypothetical protein FQ137_14590 [Dietzia sp. ANT_WB102]
MVVNDEQIEQAAQVAASAMDGYSEGACHIDHYRIIASALHAAGLLAPEPLREEWGLRYMNLADEPIYTSKSASRQDAESAACDGDQLVRRLVTDWLPADRAEGDRRADR